jgi:PAS domain S-box-containing protein
MKCHLKRLSAAFSLPVKGLVLGLLCGTLTWVILDSYQSRRLREALLQEEQKHLRAEAASNRMVFHRYLKQHVQLTKLIASYHPLVTWLNRQQDQNPASKSIRYEKERPNWFPPVSTWRGLIDPGYFLVQDTKGQLKAIYQLEGNDLPFDSQLQNTLSTGRSAGQIHFAMLHGQPNLIASSVINDRFGHKLGNLTLISQIDDEFFNKFRYVTDARNVILALFEGTEEYLIASSQPESLRPGMHFDELKSDYLVTGKPFLDYGSSGLRLQQTTLLPLERMSELNASILDAAHAQLLVAALAFTLAFTLAIVSWTRRIERVLQHIHKFSQHVSGASRKLELRVRGDALFQLESDFVRLRDEILEVRHSLSEQQRAAQRLKQLELLEAVADHLGIGVLLLEGDGHVELQTQQVDRLEETFGPACFRDALQVSPQEKELTLKDAAQKEYTFDLRRLSLFQQDDIVLVQDVTEQKHLRKRLREQELQFRRVTETAPDAIITIDHTGHVVHWNRAAEDMFQYSALESMGKPITHLMPESYREAHRSAMQQLGEEEGAGIVGKTLELEGLRKNGTAFPLELSLSTWQIDGSSYFTGIVRDITERRQVQQDLQESQSRFALFMDHLPAAAFIKDAQSRVLYVNQYLKTHFGARDSKGAFACAHSAEASERIVRDDRRALTEGQLDLVEKLMDRTGRERTFRTIKFAIPVADVGSSLLGGIAWDITDALAATESLAHSKRRYREIFDLAQEGIWLLDAEANTVEVNDRMANMLGYTVDEMRGHPLFDFMDEQARREAEVLLDRRRKGIAEKYDFRYRTKAGADCWAMVSTAPMYDGQGSYAGSLRLVTDITERKRAEDLLRSREEQLRLILASTGEGIFGLDMEGRCTFVNRACIEQLGYKDEAELLGQRMHELIHHTRHDGTEYPAEECPTYRSCTLRHVTFADDEPLWRADGSFFHAEYQSYPMVRNDSVIGAVVSFADITERKRTEEEIKRERDFAESLIETAPVIVLVLDPQGNIIRFNSFLERLSGYSLAEVKGKNWFDTFPVARGTCQISDVLKRIKDEDAAIGDLHPIVTRDGKERLITWYNTTLRGPKGELNAVLAIGHDVTEQNAKDEQLLQAQKMEIVGQLTGGIAHDFNNVLTVILGNLELLNKSVGQKLQSEAAELIEDSLSAAQDGAELTQRLLSFSRRKPLQQKRIDLPAFLSHSLRFLQRTLGTRIVVELEIDDSLDTLTCDPYQLDSAILNLALNARDAMPNGGRLVLEAKASRSTYLDPTLDPGSYVEIAVTDTGVGMAREQLSRAAEPFYTTKSSKQGSGLGLCMVFDFCEQAGGKFRLTSEQGVGTRASIILPLREDSGPEPVEPTRETKLQVIARDRTALVVEDDPRVLKLAARYLEELGYKVLTAENGDMAMEILQSESAVDLVFSDIVMPGKINGDDLYRWVVEQRPVLKVLLTTGLRSPELKDRNRTGKAPVPIALPKPYTKAQLAEAICNVLSI